MDIDMFSKMLYGKDPAEAYIESAEGKARIHINSSLLAVLQILIDKNIITEEELKEYQKTMKEIFKNQIREEFKKLQEQ